MRDGQDQNEILSQPYDEKLFERKVFSQQFKQIFQNCKSLKNITFKNIQNSLKYGNTIITNEKVEKMLNWAKAEEFIFEKEVCHWRMFEFTEKAIEVYSIEDAPEVQINHIIDDIETIRSDELEVKDTLEMPDSDPLTHFSAANLILENLIIPEIHEKAENVQNKRIKSEEINEKEEFNVFEKVQISEQIPTESEMLQKDVKLIQKETEKEEFNELEKVQISETIPTESEMLQKDVKLIQKETEKDEIVELGQVEPRASEIVELSQIETEKVQEQSEIVELSQIEAEIGIIEMKQIETALVEKDSELTDIETKTEEVLELCQFKSEKNESSELPQMETEIATAVIKQIETYKHDYEEFCEMESEKNKNSKLSEIETKSSGVLKTEDYSKTLTLDGNKISEKSDNSQKIVNLPQEDDGDTPITRKRLLCITIGPRLNIYPYLENDMKLYTVNQPIKTFRNEAQIAQKFVKIYRRCGGKMRNSFTTLRSKIKYGKRLISANVLQNILDWAKSQDLLIETSKNGYRLFKFTPEAREFADYNPLSPTDSDYSDSFTTTMGSSSEKLSLASYDHEFQSQFDTTVFNTQEKIALQKYDEQFLIRKFKQVYQICKDLNNPTFETIRKNILVGRGPIPTNMLDQVLELAKSKEWVVETFKSRWRRFNFTKKAENYNKTSKTKRRSISCSTYDAEIVDYLKSANFENVLNSLHILDPKLDKVPEKIKFTSSRGGYPISLSKQFSGYNKSKDELYFINKFKQIYHFCDSFENITIESLQDSLSLQKNKHSAETIEDIIDWAKFKDLIVETSCEDKRRFIFKDKARRFANFVESRPTIQPNTIQSLQIDSSIPKQNTNFGENIFSMPDLMFDNYPMMCEDPTLNSLHTTTFADQINEILPDKEQKVDNTGVSDVAQDKKPKHEESSRDEIYYINKFTQIHRFCKDFETFTLEKIQLGVSEDESGVKPEIVEEIINWAKSKDFLHESLLNDERHFTFTEKSKNYSTPLHDIEIGQIVDNPDEQENVMLPTLNIFDQKFQSWAQSQDTGKQIFAPATEEKPAKPVRDTTSDDFLHKTFKKIYRKCKNIQNLTFKDMRHSVVIDQDYIPSKMMTKIVNWAKRRSFIQESWGKKYRIFRFTDKAKQFLAPLREKPNPYRSTYFPPPDDYHSGMHGPMNPQMFPNFYPTQNFDQVMPFNPYFAAKMPENANELQDTNAQDCQATSSNFGADPFAYIGVNTPKVQNQPSSDLKNNLLSQIDQNLCAVFPFSPIYGKPYDDFKKAVTSIIDEYFKKHTIVHGNANKDDQIKAEIKPVETPEDTSPSPVDFDSLRF